MDEGWIKLYRQIRGHAFFKQKRVFSKFEAWVDMLLEANHCNKPWITGNEIIQVKRGTFITSEIKLMARWRWSKSKVRAFLLLLQDEKMIVKKADTKKTAISIVNYSLYQQIETAKEPEKNQKKTSKRLQKDTTKNVKNVKNVKNKDLTLFEVAINDFKEFRKGIKSPMTDRAVELLRLNLNKFTDDDKTKIAILNQSIMNGWKSVYALKDDTPKQQGKLPRAYSSIQDTVERMKQNDT